MRDSHADDCFVVHRVGVGVLASNGPSSLNAVLDPVLGVGVPGPDGALVRAVRVSISADGGGTLMRGRVSKTGSSQFVCRARFFSNPLRPAVMTRDSHADDCFVVHRVGVGVLAGNGPSGLDTVLDPILGVGVPGPDGALVRAVR